jgi:hypothetical protein
MENTNPTSLTSILHNLTATLLLFLLALSANAQVSLGSTEPHEKYQLDIVSTDKGILIARMKESERNFVNLGTNASSTIPLLLQKSTTPDSKC